MAAPDCSCCNTLRENKRLTASTVPSRLTAPPTSGASDVVAWRKIDIVHVVLRLICIVSSEMALSFMVTAHEARTLVLYGFQIPIQSEWSYSSSIQYLVGAVAAVAAHSLLQLLISVSGMLQKSSIALSRNFGFGRDLALQLTNL